VGCVVTSIADPFAAGIVAGLEEVANRHGYSVVLANSKADPKRELGVVQSLREHRVDGILVAASRLGSRYIPHLRELQIPIVLINNLQPGDFINCVTVDNREAAKLIVNHLVELGIAKSPTSGERSTISEMRAGTNRTASSAPDILRSTRRWH
jgi:DNA-binding LacI/PurR family transcriptional regulator